MSYILSYTIKCDECGVTYGRAEELPEHAEVKAMVHGDWFVDFDFALCKKCNEEIE